MDGVDKKQSRWLMASLILVMVGIVSMLISVGFLFWQLSDTRRKVEELKAILDHDHAAYGNRGIIQKSMLEEAVKKGWFTPDQKELLIQVANQADYPSR
jgi:hypothetical protein